MGRRQISPLARILGLVVAQRCPEHCRPPPRRCWEPSPNPARPSAFLHGRGGWPPQPLGTSNAVVAPTCYSISPTSPVAAIAARHPVPIFAGRNTVAPVGSSLSSNSTTQGAGPYRRRRQLALIPASPSAPHHPLSAGILNVQRRDEHLS